MVSGLSSNLCVLYSGAKIPGEDDADGGNPYGFCTSKITKDGFGTYLLNKKLFTSTPEGIALFKVNFNEVDAV